MPTLELLAARVVAQDIVLKVLLEGIQPASRDAIKAAALRIAEAMQNRASTHWQVGGARVQDALEDLFQPLPRRE